VNVLSKHPENGHARIFSIAAARRLFKPVPVVIRAEIMVKCRMIAEYQRGGAVRRQIAFKPGSGKCVTPVAGTTSIPAEQ